eukprot:Clim_evm92s108 gene=Clim_evmTU92s108
MTLENEGPRAQEMELLQAMYPEECTIRNISDLTELTFRLQAEYDLARAKDLRQAIGLKTLLGDTEPDRLIKAIVIIDLPSTYPLAPLAQTAPEVRLEHSEWFPRARQMEFQQCMHVLLHRGESQAPDDGHLTLSPLDGGNGEGVLAQLLPWLQEHIIAFVDPPKPTKALDAVNQSPAGRITREVLYMHHIYSKKKRANILQEAADQRLGGFCKPGKPGMVIVEGPERAVSDFCKVVKSWQWQRITTRSYEVLENPDTDAAFKSERFLGELSFESPSDLKHFLEERRLGHLFADTFGIGWSNKADDQYADD